MSFSQNVRFSGVAPEDAAEPQPAGRGLARALEAAVQGGGWEVVGVESWRDTGWSIACRRGAAELELLLGELEPSEWMLQIAPASAPGWIGRLRGRRPSAQRDDVLALARCVHGFLDGGFGAQRWCWDRFPEETCSTPAPAPWPGAG